MKHSIKDIILKTLLVISTVLMLLLFPGMIFIGLLFEENTAYTICSTVLNLLLVFSALFAILLPILGGIKQKPTKAEKYPLAFDDYTSFEKFIYCELKKKKYNQQRALYINDEGSITVYVRKSSLMLLDCFAIIRIQELHDELIDLANDKITEILSEYYNGKKVSDAVNMIAIFCVDRITPTFQKLVNSNIQQGFKNGRLPVGISFGGKKVYIAKQKDGFAIAHYKKLRREFLDVMNLSEEQIEKNSEPKRNAKQPREIL